MGEDMNMTPKEICEVLSNNKGYYKEVFDYFVFARAKIRAYKQFKNPNYKKSKADEFFEQFMGNITPSNCGISSANLLVN
jgi:hypothetical protein